MKTAWHIIFADIAQGFVHLVASIHALLNCYTDCTSHCMSMESDLCRSQCVRSIISHIYELASRFYWLFDLMY